MSEPTQWKAGAMISQPNRSGYLGVVGIAKEKVNAIASKEEQLQQGWGHCDMRRRLVTAVSAKPANGLAEAMTFWEMYREY